jgi:hypothetical protein
MKIGQFASVGFGCSVLVTLLLVVFSAGEKMDTLKIRPAQIIECPAGSHFLERI